MFAIRAASAHDGTRFLDDGVTVLVTDGRIAGVEGPRHEPPADCSLTTYDGTLLPGLVDAHVHLIADASFGGLERAPSLGDDQLDVVIAASLGRHAAAGVTTVRDLGDCRYRTLPFRDRADPGVPRIACAGPPLTEAAGHCHYLGGGVTGEAEVAAAVAERVDRGVDVVKVMASGGMLTEGTDVTGVQFTPAELSLAVRLAHDAGLPVVAHAHSLAGAWHALEAGVDGIEHFTCLADPGIHKPDALLARVAERGVMIGPTLGTDESKVPPLESAPPQIRELAARFGLDAAEVFRRHAQEMTRAREYGVTVVTGTDAGIGPMKDHGSAWRAVTQLAQTGYGLEAAVASATSVAAVACGLGAVTGRLAAGLAADLLVVDGDLREDADALGRPAAVWVRGTPVTA